MTEIRRQFHAVNMGSDPETNVLDSSTGELVPGSEILDAFFQIKAVALEGSFSLGNNVELKRTTKDTKVGAVHYLIPGENCHYGLVPNIVIDGTALEINTVPMYCRNHALQSVGTAMNILERILEVVNADRGTNYILTVNPTVMLSEETLAKLPEQAAIFGCDADTDIYNKSDQSVQIDARFHPLRYAGGHFHFSTNPRSELYYDPFKTKDQHEEQRKLFFAENLYRLTTLYDRLIGIAMTAINHSPLEEMRREVYGQAGRVRLQPYGGIEYRTPSSSWLLDASLYSFGLFWGQVANNLIFQPDMEEKVNELFSLGEIITAINTGDSSFAMDAVVKTCAALEGVSGLSQDTYQIGNIRKYAEYVFNNGGSEKVFAPEELKSRWHVEHIVPHYSQLNSVDRFLQKLAI